MVVEKQATKKSSMMSSWNARGHKKKRHQKEHYAKDNPGARKLLGKKGPHRRKSMSPDTACGALHQKGPSKPDLEKKKCSHSDVGSRKSPASGPSNLAMAPFIAMGRPLTQRISAANTDIASKARLYLKTCMRVVNQSNIPNIKRVLAKGNITWPEKRIQT
ncbi:hypothetical protein MRX96_037189 [Rhipicephalus microplus]